MKILLINDIGRPTGGAEFQMLALKKGLQERGHEVRLFSSRASLVEGELVADYSCFGSNSKLQVLSQTANFDAYWQLKKVLARFQPDMVHVRMFMWQLSPLILPLLKDIPCLYQTAVYKAICPAGTKILPDGSRCKYDVGIACLKNGCLTPQTWAVLMLQYRLWEQWRSAFDLVVALSYGMKAQLESAGIESVEVVYNGVPVRAMRPDLCNPPTVVYAGRLVSEKGIDVLLQAFAKVLSKVPQAQLLIAGDGVEQANLQALSNDIGIAQSVQWLGYLPQSEMERQFNNAWVQVVPSLWAEPFGNVTTEAMMRGTAVIAAAVGAQPEIVADGETGFLVPPGDVEALAQKLTLLLEDCSLSEQMGRAGRDRALSEFSEDKRNDRFLEIYKRLQAKYQSQTSVI